MGAVAVLIPGVADPVRVNEPHVGKLVYVALLPRFFGSDLRLTPTRFFQRKYGPKCTTFTGG